MNIKIDLIVVQKLYIELSSGWERVDKSNKLLGTT